jgi:hypothetical protein
MRPRREHAELDSVYWMEASKRRQALEWLKRGDLTGEERSFLETFAARFRTGPALTPGERRSLLTEYDRLARRLRMVASGPAANASRHARDPARSSSSTVPAGSAPAAPADRSPTAPSGSSPTAPAGDSLSETGA